MAAAVNMIVLDLGTSVIKAAVCSDNYQIENSISAPAPKITIHDGRYTSDAMAYLATVEQLLKSCLQQSRARPALGLCYQRSSLLIWDRSTGLPTTPLISWQDNRGEASCAELRAQQSMIQQLTGLPLTAYYFAPKIKTLFQQQPELLSGILSRQLLMGTLDSFLIWRWTSGQHYLTDASMAARTLLMDIHTRQWSPSLCDIFDIPLQCLPVICASCALNLELSNRAVLQVSVSDQSAALLASVGSNGSEVLVNLGTGGFVIRRQAEALTNQFDHYCRTLVYQDSHQHYFMATEGTLNSIAAVLQPYPYQACTINNLAECEDIYCVAEPSGIGAPFFRSDIGLEFSKSVDSLSKQQIACLLLEGIIFRTALILEEFNRQSKIERVYLSGGLSALACLQQGLAQCSPAPIYLVQQKHSGLQGVAMLMGRLNAASDRQAVLISNSAQHPALKEKYLRWKVWFKQLLR